MAHGIKISQLESASNKSSNDLLEISQNIGDLYISRKIKVVNLTSPNVSKISSNTYNVLGKKYTNTNYYLTNEDDYIRVEATSKGKYSVILPVATGSGKIYIIKNVSKKNNSYNTDVYVLVTGNDAIDIDVKSYKLRFSEYLQLIDGTIGKWEIIGKG